MVKSLRGIEKHNKKFRDAVQEEYEKLDERSETLPGWKEIGEDTEVAERAEGK